MLYGYTYNFIIHFKTEDFYEDIATDVENNFYTSNFGIYRPLPTGKNKKVIVLMKDELEEKIMTEFVELLPKTNSYWIDDDSGNKKT